MQITLNGKARTIADGASICDLLAELELDLGRKGIAVALNAEIAPRSGWPSTRLREGDRVDIINAVQGG